MVHSAIKKDKIELSPTAKLIEKVSFFIHNQQNISNLKEDDSFFTRNRILSFSTTVLMILNLFKDSVEFSMTSLLPQLGLKPVSGAAFSIARYKIKIELFLELDSIMSAHLKTLPPKLWKGYRLIAGDGTTIKVPASTQIKKHFGIFAVGGKNTKTCLTNACMLYDVLSNLVLDSIIAPVSIGEGMLLPNMIKNLNIPHAIILLDRGFGYFSTAKLLLNSNLNFCIRIKTSQSDFAKKAFENPANDFITEWIASESERKTAKNQQLDTESIKVRVTKIMLNTGEVELLVSSLLDLKTISFADISELYHYRWGIEEGYKILKPKMKLEQFSCRQHKGVYQEFYAHIFMLNLTSLLGNEAQEQIEKKTEKRKLKYKYNWQNAFKFVRQKFLKLLKYTEIQSIINEIHIQIRTSIIAIKENRTFERVWHHKQKKRYTPCYK